MVLSPVATSFQGPLLEDNDNCALSSGREGSWPEASLHTMLISSGTFPGAREGECDTARQ